MSFIAKKTILPEVLILEPQVYNDKRGYFFESYNKLDFKEITGLDINFVQDNHSRSIKNTLRGLHYQIEKPQGKLVRVIEGEVFDVVVDLRRSSKNFGRWMGTNLSSQNKKQLWIPPGFAHGFVVISDAADFVYKTSEYWFPNYERCLNWLDKDVSVDWPTENPIVSDKDKKGLMLKDATVFE